MKGKESGQRVMAVIGTADNQLLERWADDRDNAHETRGHLGRTKPFLIPGQQVPRETQPQRQQEQHHPEPIVDLARSLVGPVDDDLKQVQD